ncbi:hypothetical protein CesoFtcFv8_007873 [Champsocephalus esox]|uniref:Uncharacterized protein n=1 Tax=Champsocephalus esox TaxID=159716 RepID=A0AAN8CF83_9TELE|nr:hypothetical protein CesoFtcFv8_007873 [Champsocephalus esox]
MARYCVCIREQKPVCKGQQEILCHAAVHFLVPCQVASGPVSPSIRDTLHFDHTLGGGKLGAGEEYSRVEGSLRPVD